MKVYRERRDCLLTELDRLDEVYVLPSAAGLHVCLRLAENVDDLEIARRAGEFGVTVEPVSPRFARLQPWPGLALGFRHIGVDRIPAAVNRLGRVLRTAAS